MEEELDLEKMFAAKHGTFVLRARGDLMQEDYILDGDYVVIERRDDAKDGDQVVALLASGEAMLRRYYRDGDTVRLLPANAKRPELARVVPAADCRIQGVVIGVLRSYHA